MKYFPKTSRVFNQFESWLAAGMAHRGFTLDYIAAETHLSIGAVQYRLRLHGVSVRDYRNGNTGAAIEMRNRAVKQAKANSKKRKH